MKAVLDTNVLIYDTFEDSLFHLEAKEILDSLDEWIIPLIVIHEYVWILKSLEIAIDDVVYKVREYLDHHKTKLVLEDREDVLRALEIIRDENLSLSRYNDKIVLSIAQKVGTLVTFDKRLRKQALATKLEVLPSKIDESRSSSKI